MFTGETSVTFFSHTNLSLKTEERCHFHARPFSTKTTFVFTSFTSDWSPTNSAKERYRYQ